MTFRSEVPLIEVSKVFFVLFVGLVTLPVLLFLTLCCAVYEVLVALWWGWRWLKEVGK